MPWRHPSGERVRVPEKSIRNKPCGANCTGRTVDNPGVRDSTENDVFAEEEADEGHE
ncbi:hypothetical protein GCM10017788_37150 [Amycolatopsis acidiphila]|nr:hypothetical protein GCM10017788_37150 [Amycolatopsis acidiphila]